MSHTRNSVVYTTSYSQLESKHTCPQAVVQLLRCNAPSSTLQVRSKEPPSAGGLLRPPEGALLFGSDRSAGPLCLDPGPGGRGGGDPRVERQNRGGGVPDEDGHRVVRRLLPGAGQAGCPAPPAGEGGGGEPAGHHSAAPGVPGQKIRLGALVGAADQPLGQQLPQVAGGRALPPRGRAQLVRGAAGQRHQPGGIVQRQAPACAPRLHPAADGGPGEEGQRSRRGGGAGEAAERLRGPCRQPPQAVGRRLELPGRVSLLGAAQERGGVHSLRVKDLKEVQR